MPLCPDSLAALRHVLYGDPKRLYSFRLGEDALRRLGGAAEAFAAAQLERGFRTLDFYKSLQPLENPSK
jgi:DNA repair protein RecO (recombination protein O)